MLLLLRLRRRITTGHQRRLVIHRQLAGIHEHAPGVRILRLHQRGTGVPAIGLHDVRSNVTIPPKGQ